MAGENLPMVGKLLGHRRHRTTARYAHLADGHLVKAAEEVGTIVAQAMGMLRPEPARIEHDRALGRVMTALLKDDTELFKQFSDNESFRRWLTNRTTILSITYDAA